MVHRLSIGFPANFQAVLLRQTGEMVNFIVYGTDFIIYGSHFIVYGCERENDGANQCQDEKERWEEGGGS